MKFIDPRIDFAFKKIFGSEDTKYIDKWIWFIKYASELEEIPDNLKEEAFVHAFEKAAIANMSTEELEYYDKASMAVADQQGALELAKEEAEEKGRKEGLIELAG